MTGPDLLAGHLLTPPGTLFSIPPGAPPSSHGSGAAGDTVAAPGYPAGCTRAACSQWGPSPSPSSASRCLRDPRPVVSPGPTISLPQCGFQAEGTPSVPSLPVLQPTPGSNAAHTSQVTIREDTQERQGVAVNSVEGISWVQALEQVSDVTHMDAGLPHCVWLWRRRSRHVSGAGSFPPLHNSPSGTDSSGRVGWQVRCGWFEFLAEASMFKFHSEHTSRCSGLHTGTHPLAAGGQRILFSKNLLQHNL